jgi:phage portal protein BeeE
VPGLLERVAESRAATRSNSSVIPLDLQSYVDLFRFGGVDYPILRTTSAKLDEEQLAATATAAYHANGPVFSLVVARLQVFSQARFQWTRFEGGVPSDLFGTPALKLLERPWGPGRSGTTADLLARMEVDVSLAGNCYIRKTTGLRLNRLRPDWVTIILGSFEDAEHPGEAGDVEVAGYLYKPGGYGGQGRSVVLFPEEVAHYAPIPDPDFNFLGQSWITPLIDDVSADQAMTLHKRQFMVNAATPNLVIRFDPTVTVDQVKEFKAVVEEDHEGAFNAYKTLYLGGGADAITVGKDFQQLDFAATQGKGESRLAAAAGVPPSWVGFSEGLQGSALNAGNFGAARRRFADGTMQHLWGNAASSLEILVPDPVNAPGASLWYDTRSVSFLNEEAKDTADIQGVEAETIVKLVKDGFEWKSVIAAVKNHDWSRLKHTGLLSVQLQPPAPDQPDAGGGPPNGGQPGGSATNGNGGGKVPQLQGGKRP